MLRIFYSALVSTIIATSFATAAQAVNVEVAATTQDGKNCLVVTATEKGQAVGLDLKEYNFVDRREFRYLDAKETTGNDPIIWLTDATIELNVVRIATPTAKAVKCFEADELIEMPAVKVNHKEQGSLTALPGIFEYHSNSNVGDL